MNKKSIVASIALCALLSPFSYAGDITSASYGSSASTLESSINSASAISGAMLIASNDLMQVNTNYTTTATAYTKPESVVKSTEIVKSNSTRIAASVGVANLPTEAVSKVVTIQTAATSGTGTSGATGAAGSSGANRVQAVCGAENFDDVVNATFGSVDLKKVYTDSNGKACELGKMKLHVRQAKGAAYLKDCKSNSSLYAAETPYVPVDKYFAKTTNTCSVKTTPCGSTLSLGVVCSGTYTTVPLFTNNGNWEEKVTSQYIGTFTLKATPLEDSIYVKDVTNMWYKY